MIVVADAGPLIALAQIGHFGLLESLYRRLRIPPAVRDEVAIPGPGRPGSAEVAGAAWIEVVEPQDRTAVGLLRERLDLGESQAIVLALAQNADLLLMDEARGRRVAEARGLHKTGTVGTLIVAKRRGLIPAVAPLLDELVARGFPMGEELHRSAKALAGEN